MSCSQNMNKIKNKNLKLASQFGFKISKLSSSYPVPEIYYFICDINIGKHCTVNAFWKTQFLVVACIFCSQTDYCSCSQAQRMWILELWSLSFRGGVNRFKPMSIYIFSVLICTGNKRKWQRSLCSPKVTHDITLFLACAQPPWVSPASIQPSLTQTLLLASPQPPFLPRVSQHPYITLLSLPSTATTPNLLLEAAWHLHW